MDLRGGPAMTPTQRCQAQWLVSLTHPKVEPPADVSAVCLCRPAVDRHLNDFLLDFDETSISQPLLGEVAVQAHRAVEAIHSIRKFVRPLHCVGIPTQGAV